MTITATQVKELREKTGAGMMDCKKALSENEGQMDQAMEWLRKKGLAAAAKKSSRVAAEGLIGVMANQNRGIMVEINSETDFVSKNDKFQQFVADTSQLLLENGGDLEQLKTQAYPNSSKNVADQLTDLVSVIGENMNLRRSKVVDLTEDGTVSCYIHNKTNDEMGRIGVLVALASDAKDKQALGEVGRKIAMHVAAAAPAALNIEELDQDLVAKERRIFSEQAAASGKPPQIIEKMVEGRIRKFYKEVVLLEQDFMIETDYTITSYLEHMAKELGASSIKLCQYERFALGEGIEKQEQDFAAEVAAQLA